MSNATAALARSITRASSKQSYYTALLMVDKGLENDCLRAYAYFRWADDVIDVFCRSPEECIYFILGQRTLIERLYQGERPDDLTPEEGMMADLIAHDRGEDSGLKSFIYTFLAVLEFDARRKGRPISEAELTWYSSSLGKSVTDAIQYFVGNGQPHPESDGRYLAATAAHMTHMLRDMYEDVGDGFINIPEEYLEEHSLKADDMTNPLFRAWVRERVQLARECFREGKRYLDELEVLRCKIVAYWYCARFECVLDAIEDDGYVLRAAYDERHSFSTRLKLISLAISLTVRHVVRRRQADPQDKRQKGLKGESHSIMGSTT
jgi:phytoene/squalene synthetase